MGGTGTSAADNVRYKPNLYYTVAFSWPIYLPLIIIGCFSASDVSWEWSDSCADVISYGTGILLLMFVDCLRWKLFHVRGHDNSYFVGHKHFITRASSRGAADPALAKATWTTTQFLFTIAESAGAAFLGAWFVWPECTIYAITWPASHITAIDAAECFCRRSTSASSHTVQSHAISSWTTATSVQCGTTNDATTNPADTITSTTVATPTAGSYAVQLSIFAAGDFSASATAAANATAAATAAAT
jgi:hypothetical protein